MAFNSNFVDLQNIVVDSNDPYSVELKKYIDANNNLGGNLTGNFNKGGDDNTSELVFGDQELQSRIF